MIGPWPHRPAHRAAARRLRRARAGPYAPSAAGEAGVEFLPLDELLGRCRCARLHLPLNAESRHLLDARRFALMRPGTLVLVNVSRGAVIDTAALIAALASGRVGGAASTCSRPSRPRDTAAAAGASNVV
ncbi:MAG: NAD(P)-dependent oxidoreductase [Rubrivivax sp.]